MQEELIVEVEIRLFSQSTFLKKAVVVGVPHDTHYCVAFILNVQPKFVHHLLMALPVADLRLLSALNLGSTVHQMHLVQISDVGIAQLST